MPWSGDRITKIALARLARDLNDCRLAEGPGPILLGIITHELNDAEHLVANAGVPTAEQSRKLVERPLPPDPLVQING